MLKLCEFSSNGDEESIEWDPWQLWTFFQNILRQASIMQQVGKTSDVKALFHSKPIIQVDVK